MAARKSAGTAVGLYLAGSIIAAGPARAGSYEFWGLEAETQLQAGYALGIRAESPDDRIIATPPSPEIPIPDALKLPESNNYDDGDRNFKKGALINNRLSVLGELLLKRDDYGLLLRGDAFYDDVYRRLNNDNDSPDTINKTALPVNHYTDAARYYDGRRTRLLDAYAFGSWYLGDESVLNLRIGQQVVAWGESLFFSGVALAQGPADATKATVPGADVKSILLPVNQVALQLTLNDELTLLGQYKLEYKETELNPVGEFYSVSDVVGPGAEFIYGIKNPVHRDVLADTILNAPDLLGALYPALEPLSPLLNPLLGAPLVPEVVRTVVGVIGATGVLDGAPKNINVQRREDIRPSDYGQWGLGLRWRATPETTLGAYRLRYHNTTPAPVQNYGYAVLLPGQAGLPDITTQLLGVQVPVTYNIRYFDGIDLSALSFSTTLFGANVAGELIYRDGVDVLVDVDGGLLGPVPTPTRGKVSQALLSALYVIGPRAFWDSITVVGETGYIHVNGTAPACGPSSCSEDLTYTRNAWGYSFLWFVDRKSVFDGWDLQLPMSFAGMLGGHSSFLSGLGSLMGEGDYRASVGVNFTRLQALTLGVSYNAFLGEPDFSERPYADRDNVSLTATYRF
ncbi:MAG: DUF1302 family protein [Stagnimonas sp.]|nr:DUF1302 family protein [Stagnimonas sp.]